MTDTCIRCRKPIRYPIQRNVLPDGSLMHNDCLREYEDAMERFENAIDRMDKITKVEYSLDVNQLREDGKLRDPADYSDDKFYRYVADWMTKSNAETFKVELLLSFNNVATGYKLRMTVKKRGHLYTYHFKGIYGYFAPIFKGVKRWYAMWKYISDPAFSSFVQQACREMVWKNTLKE